MKKWVLALALLLLVGCAGAEGAEYYTNNSDVYYHTDANCNRPDAVTWYGWERVIYDRACYAAYPISEEAALAFAKRACPICVKRTEPVYLGAHMMDWAYDYAPWGIGDNQRGWDDPPLGSEAYQAEVADTYERFTAYYGADGSRRSYPDVYAGLWRNNADGFSYAVVDPTQEIMDTFKSMFGGGAWIVPAKYGYNEICALQNPIFEMVDEWREGHPEFDIFVESSAVAVNCLEVGIYGDTWEEAMPVLDAELDFPIWVRFERVTEIATWF